MITDICISIVGIDFSKHDKIEKWLKENLPNSTDSVRWSIEKDFYVKLTPIGSVAFRQYYFKSSEDAMIFALRWQD